MRGDVFFFLIAFLLIIAFVLAVMRTASNTAENTLVTSGILVVNSTNYNNTIAVTNSYNTIDDLIPLLILGGCVVVLLLGAFLSASPINFGLGLFALFVILLPASFLLSNVWHGILTTNSIAQGATQDPNTNYLVAELPVIVAIMSSAYLVVILLRYNKNGGWDEQG